MYDKFMVIFCFTLCSTEIFGLRNLIRAALQRDVNITRVRTVEELKARKGENVVLDFIGLVERNKGYTAEEYDVVTDDGYILKLHRITGSPYSPAVSGKPVVFLMHGILASTDGYVGMGSKHDLADAGYDVWLGNARGNTYSKRHIKLSSKSNNYDFWNFSLDEIGTIDLPKFLDTALEKTKQEKLTLIGHSMGTTVSYMLLSEKPEYNSKINLVVSIAPVAFFNSAFFNFLKLLAPVEALVKRLFMELGFNELLPQLKLERMFGSKLVLITFISFLSNYIDLSAASALLPYYPAGTSIYTFDHYWEMAISKEFRKYDFGSNTNKVKYGSVTPPKYNFSKIICPQAIYYADKDALVSMKDAKKLINTLKNVVIAQQAPSGYNHLDFTHAKKARNEFLVKVLHGIQKFT